VEYFAQLQSLLVKSGHMTISSFGIFAAAGAIYLCVSRGLTSLEKHHYLPAPLMATMRRIVFWLLLAASILLVLQVFGVLRSVVAAVTGVLALVSIGFVAVWSVLSNTLCSLILMITRPFRMGDTIAFPPDDFRGRVVNFNLLFTTMETEDGLLLQVPNTTFFQRPIMRKKGNWNIGLSDQLYESENASSASSPSLKDDTQKAA
jgi:small-conductance mechanosensitive channel